MSNPSQCRNRGGSSSGENWIEPSAFGEHPPVLKPSHETPRPWKSDQEGDSEHLKETIKNTHSLGLVHVSLDVDTSPTDTWGSTAITHSPVILVNVSAALPATEPASGRPQDTPAKVYQRTPSRQGAPRDVRSLQCIVKSPSRDATRFFRSDPFVREAMDAFQKTVDLSEGVS